MSKIKIGIIGAGNIAEQHLKVINRMDSVDVCGISTRTKSKAADLSKTYNISNIYDDPEELIIKQKPDGIMILVSADQGFDGTAPSACGLRLPSSAAIIIWGLTRLLVDCRGFLKW